VTFIKDIPLVTFWFFFIAGFENDTLAWLALPWALAGSEVGRPWLGFLAA